MATVPNLRVVPSIGEGAVEGAYALIPPGEYRLRFDTWSTVMLFGRQPKLVLHFTVCDYGDHFEKRLSRWYNVKRLIGKAGKQGRFGVGWSSDLLRDYSRLLGTPHRTDRIALSHLRDVLIVGRVDTVTNDRKQGALPSGCHYSVVRELIRRDQ